MTINNYQFGSITIDGQSYTKDVEVRPYANEILSWWREESHVIDAEDVKRAVEPKPDLIIIGTGESGVAQITEAAKKEIESKNIRLINDWTGTAAEIFNSETKKDQKKIIGLFHLTC